MSETPIEPDDDPTQAPADPGADVAPGEVTQDAEPTDDVDDVQEGAPATGPKAPVPPTGSEDAEA